MAYPAGGDFTTSQEINYSSSQLCGLTTEPSIIHAVTMRIVSPPDSISYVSTELIFTVSLLCQDNTTERKTQ